MKRWLALGASILIQSCLGVVYAWSTFVPALGKEHGLTSGHAGLIFGICIASFTVSMVFGGILQHKYGPHRIATLGGLLFLAGYLTGSSSGGSFPLLFIGFGVLAGAGIGFGYVCPLATGIKWFPTHKGLITGLTVAGFGLGSVFFAKVGHHFLDTGVPVLLVLQRIGWVVGISVILGALLLFVPNNVETISSNPRKNGTQNLPTLGRKPSISSNVWKTFQTPECPWKKKLLSAFGRTGRATATGYFHPDRAELPRGFQGISGHVPLYLLSG